jgi:hypothetical protein
VKVHCGPASAILTRARFSGDDCSSCYDRPSAQASSGQQKSPGETRGIFFLRKRNLTILLALLAALLTAAALLAALLPTLASGLLLLLTGLLLTALLAALLLLPALLHVAHFVVRHRELSFAETFRG